MALFLVSTILRKFVFQAFTIVCLAAVITWRTNLCSYHVKLGGCRFNRVERGSGASSIAIRVKMIFYISSQNHCTTEQDHHIWRWLPVSSQPQKYLWEYLCICLANLVGTRYFIIGLHCQFNMFWTEDLVAAQTSDHAICSEEIPRSLSQQEA